MSIKMPSSSSWTLLLKHSKQSELFSVLPVLRVKKNFRSSWSPFPRGIWEKVVEKWPQFISLSTKCRIPQLDTFYSDGISSSFSRPVLQSCKHQQSSPTWVHGLKANVGKEMPIRIFQSWMWSSRDRRLFLTPHMLVIIDAFE